MHRWLYYLVTISFLLLYGCNMQNKESLPSESHASANTETVQTTEPNQKTHNDEETIDTVSQDEVDKIQVSDYFPLHLGTSRIYQTEDNGKPVGLTKQTIKYYGSSSFRDKNKPLTFAILSQVSLGDAKFNKLEVEEVTKESIRLTHSENSALNINSDPNINELSNRSEWKVDEETQGYITATGKEIQTEAGTFLNCIEVTQVASMKDKKIYIKKYYAPQIGHVMTKMKNGDAYTIFEQLIDFHIPNGIMPPMKTDSDNINQGNNATIEQTYLNDKYGFSLTLPSLWDQYYVVEEGEWKEDQSIMFRFKANNQNYSDNIVVIYVSNKSKAEIEGENQESPFPMPYIATKDGLSFTYQYNVGDPSSEILANPNDLEILMKLKDSVPQVMKSFRFNR